MADTASVADGSTRIYINVEMGQLQPMQNKSDSFSQNYSPGSVLMRTLSKDIWIIVAVVDVWNVLVCRFVFIDSIPDLIKWSILNLFRTS